MEDDEEIQSQPSPGTGSPASPRPNGRITVTVAAAPPSQNTLTLALPIQQPKASGVGGSGGGVGGGGGGREDCWSEGATAVLVEAWGERYMELSRGNLKQKHWKEVADIVNSREDLMKIPKTDIQCKNRIDTVKKKYKAEKAKIAGGGGPSKWPFYKRLDQLIGPTAKTASAAAASNTPPFSSHQKVPVGIPVGIRSAVQYHPLKPHQPEKPKRHLFRRPVADSDESESEPEGSPDSTDSFPPERKRPKIQRESNPAPVKDRERERGWGKSVRELSRAILRFGEAYEQVESSKMQQVVEMEKQRMKFTKDMELQRMQFFMKTQVELSQLNHGRRGSQ